jgi:putative oxidoreductase
MANGSNGPLPLIGRILVSVIFIASGLGKLAAFNMMVGMLAAKGFPAPAVALGIAAAVEIFGGLALLLGFHTRVAAWVLFLFLIPTTLAFHNFWALSGMEKMDNQAHFFKNVAIMGGLIFLAAFGAGAYSIDNKRAAA